jgi:hypothetical protein
MVSIGFAEFDALASLNHVAVGLAEFDAQAVRNVSVGFAEFDSKYHAEVDQSGSKKTKRSKQNSSNRGPAPDWRRAPINRVHHDHKPPPVHGAQIKAQQRDIKKEEGRLSVLLLEIERQLLDEIANAQAINALQAKLEAIQAQREALKAEQASLAMLAAYEALMRRIDEQDIEILLMAL